MLARCKSELGRGQRTGCALLYSTALVRVHASRRRGAGKERGNEEADHQGDASVTE